jgi:hypothetical protein
LRYPKLTVEDSIPSLKAIEKKIYEPTFNKRTSKKKSEKLGNDYASKISVKQQK